LAYKKKYRLFNFSLKLLISVALVYVIYLQLDSKSFSAMTWEMFFSSVSSMALVLLMAAILLMFLNLSLEALKWYLLVNRFEKHSFTAAFLDILSGITGGLVTPAAIGDYAARILKISPENNWKGIWSNAVNSLSQNIIVVFSGLAGAMILIYNRYNTDPRIWYFSVISGSLIAIVSILIFFNLHWLQPLFHKIALKTRWNKVFISYETVTLLGHRILLNVLVLSFFRYAVFVFQYYLLLRFWGIHGQILMMISAISAIYLIQTVMAVPPVLYWLIRGELAILMLGHFTDNTVFILAATLSLWIINQAIPAAAGWMILINTNIGKSLGYEPD
jgi:uncharacterized membrane protein YbhN (UPF0104 family)